MEIIPFNRPFMTGRELEYIKQAHEKAQLAGDGTFTKLCQNWLTTNIGCHSALLTHSCTAALEMAAILIDVGPGDEIILPSYTFVSTANAFALRGATPVFVDIRSDTQNIDESKIEAAITQNTKAIVAVHYAGVACEMDTILTIAAQHDIFVIEDAAQAILSTYKGRQLGSIGHLGALSFHETKNIISGEGGALLINDSTLLERAEIIREKGTNRSRFIRGQIDKYTWTDIGSSYLPGEIIAAFLWAQLQEARSITKRRLLLWDTYFSAFQELEKVQKLQMPFIPADCEHNAHMFYLLLKNETERNSLIQELKLFGINAVFHYVPLHSSDFGIRVSRASGNLKVTMANAARLVRLPLWLGMENQQNCVIDTTRELLRVN